MEKFNRSTFDIPDKHNWADKLLIKASEFKSALDDVPDSFIQEHSLGIVKSELVDLLQDFIEHI